MLFHCPTSTFFGLELEQLDSSLLNNSKRTNYFEQVTLAFLISYVQQIKNLLAHVILVSPVKVGIMVWSCIFLLTKYYLSLACKIHFPAQNFLRASYLLSYHYGYWIVGHFKSLHYGASVNMQFLIFTILSGSGLCAFCVMVILLF